MGVRRTMLVFHLILTLSDPVSESTFGMHDEGLETVE